MIVDSHSIYNVPLNNLLKIAALSSFLCFEVLKILLSTFKNISTYNIRMTTKEFIKRMTTVPNKFVDELFEFYDEHTLQTDFVINLDHVAKWLQIGKNKLLLTLRTSYRRDIDYIIEWGVKNPNQKDKRNNNYKLCLITPDCFKRLCMMSRAKNADMVRTYFIEIEALFMKHKDTLILGMQQEIDRLNKKSMKTNYPKGQGYIYIIKASPQYDSVYKIGRSMNLKARLSTYMTGRVEDLDVLYVYKAEDVHAVEQCVKGFLAGKRYMKYKELYKVEIEHVKRLIGRCDNVGKLEIMYQRKKALTYDQDGGFYVALYPEHSST